MNEFVKQLAEDFSDKEYAHAYMEEHENMRIAAQIRALREERGLSQEQLAQLAGMKQERISVLENSEYDAWTLKTLRKLASAFDTNLTVEFSRFSDAIMKVANLRPSHLAVPDREKDLGEFKTKRVLFDGNEWRSVSSAHLSVVTKFPTGPVTTSQNWQTLVAAR